ncbi:hypothetical protein IFR04_000169 [Cadophora malorum]|uniref:Uncharacterized protein n=1 Tax=Cadophora malorum TaxID=108018 RepID=A0A8H7WL95_9HELO|nr:hypothetical protein IFR04_000169 [Cadophora malorum]
MEYQKSKPESPDSNAIRRKSDSPTNTNTTTSTNTQYTNMSPLPRPRRPSDFNVAQFNPSYHTFQPQPQKPLYAPPPPQPPRSNHNTRPQPRRQPPFTRLPPPIKYKSPIFAPAAPPPQTLPPKDDTTISKAEQERLHHLAKHLAKERTEHWVESLFEMHPNV